MIKNTKSFQLRDAWLIARVIAIFGRQVIN